MNDAYYKTENTYSFSFTHVIILLEIPYCAKILLSLNINHCLYRVQFKNIVNFYFVLDT